MEEARKAFVANTVNHKMHIVADHPTGKHLRFSNGGSSIASFGIVTWDNHLCIYGDMGTYVFMKHSLPDMIEFFSEHTAPLSANGAAYLAEKLISADVEASSTGSIWEFDPDKAIIAIEALVEEGCPALDAEDTERIEDMRSEDEFYSFLLANDYFFGESLDVTCMKFRFLWVLNAIIWDVETYKQHKKEEELQERSRVFTRNSTVQESK